MQNNFRHLIQIVESEGNIIVENPFTNILASLGNGRSQGENDRKKLVKTMTRYWNQWIGRTGLPGNIDDMKKFLYDVVGFEPNEINKILGIKVGDPPESPDSPEQPETPDQEDSSPAPPRASSNTNARDELDKASRGFNNVVDHMTMNISSFLKDPQDTDLLMNISKGIDTALSFSRKMWKYDKRMSVMHADEVVKYLEYLIKSKSLNTRDEIRAKDKIKDIDAEFDKRYQTKESIFNYIIGRAGLLTESSDSILSDDQVSKILDSAARFIFSNDLLGQNAPENDGSGEPAAPAPAKSNASPGPSSSVLTNIRKMGLGQEDLENLSKLAKDRSFNMANLKPDDAKAVEAIGWAFLRTLNY